MSDHECPCHDAVKFPHIHLSDPRYIHWPGLKELWSFVEVDDE